MELEIYIDKMIEKKHYAFAKKFLEKNKQILIKSILENYDYKEFFSIFKKVANINIKYMYLAENLYIELSKIVEIEKNKNT